MQTFLGMILGAILTVLGAYIYDSIATGPSTASANPPVIERRTMVNWDVVGDNWRTLRSRMRQEWNRLHASVNS